MGNSTVVPWFGPIPPIGCQGTQKATGGTTTRNNDGDRWHDNGYGRHNNSKGQQATGGMTTVKGSKTMATGGGQHDDGRHDNGKGQQGKRHHDNGDRRHDGGDGWHDDGIGRHDDGEGHQGNGRHDGVA